MKIENLNDWYLIDKELKSQIQLIGYNSDLAKIKKNLDFLVTELSKQEVEARRMKNPMILKPIIDKINDSISIIERYVLLLQLSK